MRDIHQIPPLTSYIRDILRLSEKLSPSTTTLSAAKQYILIDISWKGEWHFSQITQRSSISAARLFSSFGELQVRPPHRREKENTRAWCASKVLYTRLLIFAFPTHQQTLRWLYIFYSDFGASLLTSLNSFVFGERTKMLPICDSCYRFIGYIQGNFTKALLYNHIKLRVIRNRAYRAFH